MSTQGRMMEQVALFSPTRAEKRARRDEVECAKSLRDMDHDGVVVMRKRRGVRMERKRIDTGLLAKLASARAENAALRQARVDRPEVQVKLAPKVERMAREPIAMVDMASDVARDYERIERMDIRASVLK